MRTTTRSTTAAELLRLPRGEFRYELIQGELRTMSPAGYEHGAIEHGAIAVNSGWRLAQHVLEQNLGQVLAAETGFLSERDPLLSGESIVPGFACAIADLFPAVP